MFLPKARKTGSARSKAASLPPAITVSVPACAPPGPPDTGASRKSAPFLRSTSAHLRLSRRLTVEQSAYTCPLRATAASSPYTSSTLSCVGSALRTISARSAISRGELAALAPFATRSSTAPRERLCTCNAKPAASSFSLMGRPILPSPMNPTSTAMRASRYPRCDAAVVLRVGGEHLAGVPRHHQVLVRRHDQHRDPGSRRADHFFAAPVAFPIE